MDLSMQIVKHLLVDKDDEDLSQNFIISPLSLTSLLTIVACANKGETLEKLMSLLGFKSVADLIHESHRFKSLCSSGPVIFSSVNGVWVDRKYKLKHSFKQVVNFMFNSHSSTVDFQNKLEEAVEEINKWGEKATRGLIKESFPEEYAKRKDTVIVLANALYFKGLWKWPFSSYISTGKFHTLDGDSVQVPYMREYCTTYLCGSYRGTKILRLSYKSGGPTGRNKYAMYLFIPEEKHGIHDLLQQFSSDSALINLRLELREVLVGTLMIPKFKFKYGFEVTNIMEKLGVVMDIKDSEMLEDIGGDGDLGVIENMKTFHSCCIEVNEHGTEAAASSCILKGGGFPPPGEIIADRPFVFVISEDYSKTPVFLGVVVNPLLG